MKRRSRRRDRRGRGPRGPLAWPAVPAMATRAERFDDLVIEAATRLEETWGNPFPPVEFGVEDVPPSDPAPWEHSEVPLGRLFGAEGREPARIVIYRRPVETRTQGQRELARHLRRRHRAGGRAPRRGAGAARPALRRRGLSGDTDQRPWVMSRWTSSHTWPPRRGRSPPPRPHLRPHRVVPGDGEHPAGTLAPRGARRAPRSARPGRSRTACSTRPGSPKGTSQDCSPGLGRLLVGVRGVAPARQTCGARVGGTQNVRLSHPRRSDWLPYGTARWSRRGRRGACVPRASRPRAPVGVDGWPLLRAGLLVDPPDGVADETTDGLRRSLRCCRPRSEQRAPREAVTRRLPRDQPPAHRGPADDADEGEAGRREPGDRGPARADAAGWPAEPRRRVHQSRPPHRRAPSHDRPHRASCRHRGRPRAPVAGRQRTTPLTVVRTIQAAPAASSGMRGRSGSRGCSDLGGRAGDPGHPDQRLPRQSWAAGSLRGSARNATSAAGPATGATRRPRGTGPGGQGEGACPGRRR